MGKWTNYRHRIDFVPNIPETEVSSAYFGNDFVYAGGEASAAYACAAHNADIDALTARAEAAEKSSAEIEANYSYVLIGMFDAAAAESGVSAADYFTAMRDERDQYKPFHDAVVDMAVVNWTYDAKTERDAHDAIKKLVHCYCMKACEPAINENLAKLVAEKEAAERKLREVVEMLEPGERPKSGKGFHHNAELRDAAWCTRDSLHRRAVEIAEGGEC